MNHEKNLVAQACELVGSQAELARIMQVSPAMVNQLVKGARPVPLEHCMAIEKATTGRITRQALRPNDFWRIWPDLAHLEPKGAAS